MYPNLIVEMKRAKISQKRLSRLCGITPQTMSRKLSGNAKITTKEAMVIHSLFPKYSYEYLFERRGDNE